VQHERGSSNAKRLKKAGSTCNWLRMSPTLQMRRRTQRRTTKVRCSGHEKKKGKKRRHPRGRIADLAASTSSCSHATAGREATPGNGVAVAAMQPWGARNREKKNGAEREREREREKEQKTSKTAASGCSSKRCSAARMPGVGSGLAHLRVGKESNGEEIHTCAQVAITEQRDTKTRAYRQRAETGI
jgi:hypothetical protein